MRRDGGMRGRCSVCGRFVNLGGSLLWPEKVVWGRWKSGGVGESGEGWFEANVGLGGCDGMASAEAVVGPSHYVVCERRRFRRLRVHAKLSG